MHCNSNAFSLNILFVFYFLQLHLFYVKPWLQLLQYTNTYFEHFKREKIWIQKEREHLWQLNWIQGISSISTSFYRFAVAIVTIQSGTVNGRKIAILTTPSTLKQPDFLTTFTEETCSSEFPSVKCHDR